MSGGVLREVRGRRGRLSSAAARYWKCYCVEESECTNEQDVVAADPAGALHHKCREENERAKARQRSFDGEEKGEESVACREDGRSDEEGDWTVGRLDGGLKSEEQSEDEIPSQRHRPPRRRQEFSPNIYPRLRRKTATSSSAVAGPSSRGICWGETERTRAISGIPWIRRTCVLAAPPPPPPPPPPPLPPRAVLSNLSPDCSVPRTSTTLLFRPSLFASGLHNIPLSLESRRSRGRGGTLTAAGSREGPSQLSLPHLGQREPPSSEVTDQPPPPTSPPGVGILRSALCYARLCCVRPLYPSTCLPWAAHVPIQVERLPPPPQAPPTAHSPRDQNPASSPARRRAGDCPGASLLHGVALPVLNPTWSPESPLGIPASCAFLTEFARPPRCRFSRDGWKPPPIIASGLGRQGYASSAISPRGPPLYRGNHSEIKRHAQLGRGVPPLLDFSTDSWVGTDLSHMDKSIDEHQVPQRSGK
ncbi:unnamed protein product [Diplocarpon coronariae]